MNRPTPETDAVELHYRQVCDDKNAPMYLVPADFARTLERDRDRLSAALQLIVDGMPSEHFREWAQGISKAALAKHSKGTV